MGALGHLPVREDGCALAARRVDGDVLASVADRDEKPPVGRPAAEVASRNLVQVRAVGPCDEDPAARPRAAVAAGLRRLGDDVASAAVRTRQVEDAVSAPRQIAAKPAPLPPARAPVTAMDSERWIPSEHVAPPSLPPPHQVRPQAEAIVPSAKDPTTHSAPSSAARVPSDNASSSNTPPTLMDKLRGDWRTIKQGFATAGDDFKTNMRDLARRVRVRGE